MPPTKNSVRAPDKRNWNTPGFKDLIEQGKHHLSCIALKDVGRVFFSSQANGSSQGFCWFQSVVCRALTAHELLLKVSVKTDLICHAGSYSSSGEISNWSWKLMSWANTFFRFRDNLCWHILVIEKQRLKIICKYSHHRSELFWRWWSLIN